MATSKQGPISVSDQQSLALITDIDDRDRVKLPTRMRTVAKWPKRMPRKIVLRLLAKGQVACMVLDNRLQAIIDRGLSSADPDIADAFALSVFNGTVYANENRFTLPDEVIHHLISPPDKPRSIWVFARPGMIELWSADYYEARRSGAAKVLDAFFDEKNEDSDGD